VYHGLNIDIFHAFPFKPHSPPYEDGFQTIIAIDTIQMIFACGLAVVVISKKTFSFLGRFAPRVNRARQFFLCFVKRFADQWPSHDLPGYWLQFHGEHWTA
jgi:hypothetical protein